MAVTITTCMVNQAKVDLLQGGLIFAMNNVQVGNTATTNLALFSLTNTFNLVAGMSVTGNNIPAAGANVAYVTQVINSTAVQLSVQPTAASNGTYTFAGDTFKIALINGTATGTMDTTTVSNYANIFALEITGTGYTSNGVALTVNNIPVPSGGYANLIPVGPNTAVVDFEPDPSWAAASFTTIGAAIYNTRNHFGYTMNTTAAPVLAGPAAAYFGVNTALHAVSLHDFGGSQQVTSGTFTVVMPTANGSAAILRIA